VTDVGMVLRGHACSLWRDQDAAWPRSSLSNTFRHARTKVLGTQGRWRLATELVQHADGWIKVPQMCLRVVVSTCVKAPGLRQSKHRVIVVASRNSCELLSTAAEENAFGSIAASNIV